MTTPIGREALPWNLGFALSQLGSRVRQEFVTGLAPWQLRPAHYGVLVGLAALGSPSQRDLASAIGIDDGDLVGFLDTLEQRGFVQRVRDPADRRRHVLGLTAAGQELLRDLDQVAERVVDAFFVPLDEAERAQLEVLLSKLWDASAPP
jgi:MarR family transcriptional regulator, lower aerobic nicotinate degradation pathway regulator